ncbi:MAG: hypothetical protein ABUT39_27190 [Acidobacteriota bacterium]
MTDRSQPRRAALVCVALGLSASPLLAGEFRVVLGAQTGVRSDGNYDQVENLERSRAQEGEVLARSAFDLRLSYELPRMRLALDYSPSYEWVLDDADVNGTTHRLELGLSGNLTRRLKATVRERLASSSTLDLYSPFTEAETIAVTRRGDQLSHALDVALDQELTRRTAFLLGVSHTLRTFEEEDLADSETLSARIGVGFRVAPERKVEVLATDGTYDFGDGSTELRQLGRNGEADVRTLSLGWSQKFLRDGSFRVEAGAYSVDSTRVGGLAERRVEESDAGWRGSLGLSRQLESFGWSLGYRHDISAGAGFGRAVRVDNAFAGVSTRAGRSLTLGLDANASRHEDLSEESARLVETAAGTARFQWSFSRAAALNGGISYIRQDSQVEPFEDLSYSRYFLGLALQLYRSGEEPRSPADAGGTDDEPDAQ